VNDIINLAKGLALKTDNAASTFLIDEEANAHDR